MALRGKPESLHWEVNAPLAAHIQKACSLADKVRPPNLKEVV